MRPNRGGDEFSPAEPEDLPGIAIMAAMAVGVLATFVAIVWAVFIFVGLISR